MTNKLIDKAIRVVGTQSELAKLCGVQQQHVWNWLNRDKRVPADRCRAIQDATGGEITVHDLRPDVFGPKPERRTGTDRRNSKHSNPNGPERRQGERRNKAA